MPDGPGIRNHAIEIEQLGRALEQRESLLNAVSDIAGQMLELDGWVGIEQSLRRLAEAADVQRVSLLVNRTDESDRLLISLRHEWSDPSVEPQIDNPAWQDMFWADLGLQSWRFRLESGRPFAFCLSELDGHQLAVYVSQGILSLAAVPVFVQGHWWGTLFFDDCRRERLWPEAELDALQTVARLFTSFILRLRNEESLVQSEARYRGIVEALPDIIMRIDDNMRFIDVRASNPGQLFFPPDQFIGRTPAEVLPVEAAAMAESHFAAAFAAGTMQVFNFTVDIEGRTRDYESRLTPCGDRELLAIVRDVTEARQAERRLRESEARFRSMVQAMPDFVFRIDDRLRFTDVQTAQPEKLLVPPEQIIGKTPSEVLPPDVAAMAEQHLRAAFSSREMQIFHSALDVRGESLEYENRIVPCSDRELLAIVRDVTEARQAERRLRESEARYTAVVNDQTELLCRFGPDSTLSFVNEAYCRYFGKKQEELLGEKFMPMVSQEDLDIVSWMFASLSKEQPFLVYEHRVLDANGEARWVEWTNRVILDDRGEIVEYQSVGRDVTERKDLQRRLLASVENEHKRLAQELHDGLCQDLKSLEIEAALLEDRLAADDADARERAVSVGRRANQAIRSTYDLIRGMLPVGLDARGFGPALADLAQKAREHAGCRIACSLRADLLPASEDQANHLYRIAQEALTNALRHAGAREIWLAWDLVEDRAVLSVRDDGIGFDAAGPRWKNRGVGLLLLESRAQDLGARLRIDSAPGGGTEVRCSVNEWRLDDRRSEP